MADDAILSCGLRGASPRRASGRGHQELAEEAGHLKTVQPRIAKSEAERICEPEDAALKFEPRTMMLIPQELDGIKNSGAPRAFDVIVFAPPGSGGGGV